MTPARLDHPNLGIGEKMNRALEQLSRRDKISVQNADKFTGGRCQSDCERTRLEAGPIDPMNQLNIEAAVSQLFSAQGSQIARIIGGIVQDLDLQQFARVIEFAD